MSKEILKCKVKYHDDSLPRIEKIKQGDWIDLRSSEDILLVKDKHVLIPLGVSIQLPVGYEALLVPRSSSYKKWGFIQPNSPGVIDEAFSGEGDQWKLSVLPMKCARINKGDRICQFRIQEKMPEVIFEEVESLQNEDRGGYGSTGEK